MNIIHPFINLHLSKFGSRGQQPKQRDPDLSLLERKAQRYPKILELLHLRQHLPLDPERASFSFATFFQLRIVVSDLERLFLIPMLG